jgi:transglutaminase-like putative cysteine protease
VTKDRCEKKARTVRVRYWLWAVLSLSGYAPAFADNRYDVVATPTWVAPAELPTDAAAHGEQQGGGATYVLVDRQSRVSSTLSNYSRLVTRLDSVSGVEDHSQITVVFDPQTEKLHLHAVLIRRGTRVIDQLLHGRIRILQREGDLEQGIVDGTLTFHLLLADVRVGDTIDTSYTVERRSPEWRNRYYETYPLQWDDPVILARVRVSTPNNTPLRVRSHGTEVPRQWKQQGWDYTEWVALRAPSLQPEKHIPRWFEQYASVAFSQFVDWSAIAEQANRLYAITTSPSTELAALTDQLRSAGNTAEDRAVAVMQFVQDDVRYTGIEEGEYAFRPTSPNEVLRRRYGDCKDKTLLAVTLLKDMGIEAAPALVSTRWRAHLADQLPSPNAFNHVVIRAKISGKLYWFDATSTGQSGRLPNFTQAHFGLALAVMPSSTELEPMPGADSTQPVIHSHATFDFSDGVKADATLTVATSYLGREADAERRALRTDGPDKLANDYLHYYKGRYPDATMATPLHVRDDTEKNELTITETYRLRHAFESDEKGKDVFYLHADTITDELKTSDTAARTMPLAVDFPSHLASTINILLPTSWHVTEGVETVEVPAFHYDSRTRYSANKVTLDYRYHALADYVSADEVAVYLKALQRATDDTYFNLSDEPETAWSLGRATVLAKLKYILLVGGTYIGLRLARFGFSRLVRRRAISAAP